MVGILAGMHDTEYTLHARCEDMESYYSYDSKIDKSRVRTLYSLLLLRPSLLHSAEYSIYAAESGPHSRSPFRRRVKKSDMHLIKLILVPLLPSAAV